MRLLRLSGPLLSGFLAPSAQGTRPGRGNGEHRMGGRILGVDAKTYPLQDILKPERRYIIPTFQRDYEWTLC